MRAKYHKTKGHTMKIALICNFTSLGDNIINIKALYALKMLYPNGTVSFITKKAFARVFENLAFIDELAFIDDLTNGGGGGFRFTRA